MINSKLAEIYEEELGGRCMRESLIENPTRNVSCKKKLKSSLMNEGFKRGRDQKMEINKF